MSALSPAQVVWPTCGMNSKVVGPWLRAGRPPEVVDRHGVDAVLREPQGELLEVRMQAADVGQDDDPGTGRRSAPVSWNAAKEAPSRR